MFAHCTSLGAANLLKGRLSPPRREYLEAGILTSLSPVPGLVRAGPAVSPETCSHGGHSVIFV